MIINSNDIVVFITNDYKQTFYLDQLSFLQLNINNNATPIYSQFYKDIQGVAFSHFVVSGALGFNQVGFNALKKLHEQIDEQIDSSVIKIENYKNKLIFPKMTIKNKLQVLNNQRDDIILEEVVFFTNQNTTTIDGTPSQEVYQFYQKYIKFDNTSYSVGGFQILGQLGVLSQQSILDTFDNNKLSNQLKVDIIEVLDGDTLKVSIKNGQNNYLYSLIETYLVNNQIDIRLQNIDQPETGTIGENKTGDKYVSEAGQISKRFILDNIIGKYQNYYIYLNSNQLETSYDNRVTLDLVVTNGTDNISIQALMVENGMADVSFYDKWSIDDLKSMDELNKLKAKQLINNKGLYQQKNSQPITIDELINYKGQYRVVQYNTNKHLNAVELKFTEYKHYDLYNISDTFKIAIPTQIRYKFNNLFRKLYDKMINSQYVFGEIYFNSTEGFYYIILNNENQLN